MFTLLDIFHRVLLFNVEINQSVLLILLQITFYMINPPLDNWGSSDASSRGEIEIENLPAREVHIRNKDLLPVFQHFHSVQPDWHDRY